MFLGQEHLHPSRSAAVPAQHALACAVRRIVCASMFVALTPQVPLRQCSSGYYGILCNAVAHSAALHQMGKGGGKGVGEGDSSQATIPMGVLL